MRTDNNRSILYLFSRDTYVVDMVLARVIQNTVRTLAVTAMIVVVIGYSFPLFVRPSANSSQAPH